MNFVGSSSASEVSQPSTAGATLRIVTVNDVYEIDNLARLRTCVDEVRSLGDKTICTLPGDFVAPSLLSSLDKGGSMIRCMNIAGVDYVCIGNHESDIPLSSLQERIVESNFTWINSNIPDLPLPEGVQTPPYVVVEVRGNGFTRKVALLGLCTEDRSVMKPGAFKDAVIEPVAACAERLHRHLTEVMGVDCVVPLTHQLIGLDREMAKMGVGFPLLIGGHDHEPYVETINNCGIIKVGMDATHIGLVELIWPDEAYTAPIVNMQMVPATNYKANAEVQECIEKSKMILKEIEQSRLFSIPKDMMLSSVGVRLRPTSVGTMLCSTIKEALKCDACFIGGGSVRANKTYTQAKFFSYADLKAEVPFDTLIIIMELPGEVCAQMITHTREPALRSPPVAKGAYLQTDDGIKWNSRENTVLEINRAPLDKSKTYRVCMNYGMCQGLDDVTPLINWMASKPASDLNAHPDIENSMDAKHIIVEHFSQIMLYDIIMNTGGDLSLIDTDNSGNISKQELKEFIVKNSASSDRETVTDMLIDNLFNSADLDSTGCLNVSNLLSMSSSHLADLSHHFDDGDSLISIEDAISDIEGNLPPRFEDEFKQILVSEFREHIRKVDHDGDLFITWSDYKEYLHMHCQKCREISSKMRI